MLNNPAEYLKRYFVGYIHNFLRQFILICYQITLLVGLLEISDGRIWSFPCRYHSTGAQYSYICGMNNRLVTGPMVAAVHRRSLTPSTSLSSSSSSWGIVSFTLQLLCPPPPQYTLDTRLGEHKRPDMDTVPSLSCLVVFNDNDQN
jgi:hypothetical protein